MPEEFRTGDALFILDEALRIRSWNEAVERLTGIPAEDVIGLRCWEVIGGLDNCGGVVCHARCAYARAAFKGSDVASHPLCIRTASGRREVTVSTIVVGAKDQQRLIHLMRERPAAAPPPGAVIREVEQLTPRQREVLALLGEGLGAKAIAVELGIAISTVRAHIREILLQLGVHSQLAAVTRATTRSRPPS